jgi:type II secretion system protein N
MNSFSISKILKKGGKWISFILVLASVFFVIFFPTGDLGDFVSTKVSEVTQNQVFLQFSEFGLNVLPPALKFSEVFVETPFFPAVTTANLSISPSISAMISRKPYGSIKANGLFKGDVKIDFKKGTASELAPERHRLLLSAENLDLKSLRDTFNFPVSVTGRLNLEADGQADVEGKEQPEMELVIVIEDFNLPTATVSTMMGPLTLPELKLGKVEIKGRLSNGNLIIEQGDIGQPKDELSGKIKGKWAMTINSMQGYSPNLGAYDIDINLVAKKSFQNKAGLFLSLLDSYKSIAGDGAAYHFKVSAINLDSPPNITAAQ